MKLSFRSDYGKFSLVLLVITLVSLAPQYLTSLLTEPGSVSPQLLFHGAVFMAWYVLFSFQSGLISARQIGTHKKLGYASIAFALILVLSGAAMLFETMSSYQADWTEQHLRGRTSFVWAIFHTLISFACFYVLAIASRKNGQAHKRLMLLASLSMMSATITRFAFLPIIPIDGTAFTLLFTYVLLATPIVIDRVRGSSVHPVLLYGTTIYAVTQLIVIGLVPTTELGRSLAFPF